MSELRKLNILHILNDGYLVSMPLLLPFIAEETNMGLDKVGLLGTSLGAMSVFLALPAAYLASKYGGMKMLILAILFYGIGFILTSVSNSFVVLVIALLIAGLGFGVFHPIAFSLTAKLADKKRTGAAMANFTAIGDVGRIGLATVITYVVTFFGWRRTGLFYGCVAMVFGIILWIFYKKSSGHIDLVGKSLALKVRLGRLFKNRKYMLSVVVGFIDSMASSSLFIFLPFLLLYRGVAPEILGGMTASFFVGNLVGKSLLGRFVDKFKLERVFIISEILMAIFIVALASTPVLILIITFSVILGALTKGTVPVINVMLSRTVEDNEYDEAYGFNALTTSSAYALAPVVFGFVAEKTTIIYAFYGFAAMSILTVLPLLVLQKGN